MFILKRKLQKDLEVVQSSLSPSSPSPSVASRGVLRILTLARAYIFGKGIRIQRQICMSKETKTTLCTKPPEPRRKQRNHKRN